MTVKILSIRWFSNRRNPGSAGPRRRISAEPVYDHFRQFLVHFFKKPYIFDQKLKFHFLTFTPVMSIFFLCFSYFNSISSFFQYLWPQLQIFVPV